MEVVDKGWLMTTVGVSGWMFLLVLAEKKHSPTHTYRGHQSSLICFLHLLWSIASSLFNLHAWQSFFTISRVFFGLPLAGHPPLHTPSTSSNKCLHHFVHATLYTTTFPVYPLLTISTLYWIIANASITDTTWPSYSLLCYLLLFPTDHNLGFIHIYSHASILRVILPLIKPFN